MLKKVTQITEIPGIRIKDAQTPSFFPQGLEYGAPARGMWNIVHTGMLIPQAHEIFVCAKSCLRGVVLTAAEMNASHRFSTVEIRTGNLQDGTMEELIIEGVTEILETLPSMPPAVLVYTSCVHHFVACDIHYVLDILRQKFTDVSFTDCYMNPIMRKSGLTPDQIMRKQLYSFLMPSVEKKKTVNIIGNDITTDSSSELTELISKSGYKILDITTCKSYKEYLEMSKSLLNISTYPSAKAAGDELKKRLGITHIHLGVSFSYEKIKDDLELLSDILDVEIFDHETKIEKCEKRIKKLKELLGNTPIAIDYTAVSCPFSLAEYLVNHGFYVKSIFADSANAEDKSAIENLKLTSPDIMIYPTVHHSMRFTEGLEDSKVLAIGQKAAYFCKTQHFVNIVQNGGHWGYDGILRLADEIEDAFLNKKDTKKLIQIKGLGCGCC